ncbi:site-specific integrase [Chitinimonas koreensis]|nr:site-specific integrase [Chitinimonas koreensis]
MTAAGPSALERFERHLAGEAGRSAATREAYLADARLLLELAGATPLEALTPRAIRGCVRQLRQRGHDPRSIARRLSAWRAWFRLLRREGWWRLTRSPASRRRVPRRSCRGRSASMRRPASSTRSTRTNRWRGATVRSSNWPIPPACGCPSWSAPTWPISKRPARCCGYWARAARRAPCRSARPRARRSIPGWPSAARWRGRASRRCS